MAITVGLHHIAIILSKNVITAIWILFLMPKRSLHFRFGNMYLAWYITVVESRVYTAVRMITLCYET